MITNTENRPITEFHEPHEPELIAHHVSAGIPFILRQGANQWPIMKLWQQQYFSEHYGPTAVTAKKKGGLEKRFTLASYFKYINHCEEADPWYLSDWSFTVDYPELDKAYKQPDYFKNWLRRIPAEMLHGPQYNYLLRWIYIGPKNSSMGLHIDLLATCAWNALLSGEKHWLFYSPDQSPYLYDGKVDAFELDTKLYPLCSHAKSFHCIQHPGDIVFTPSSWWHQVKNYKAGISLTENFIHQHNVQGVAQELLNSVHAPILEVLKAYIPELFDHTALS